MKMEAGKDLAVYQQQRHPGGGKDHRQEAHQALRDHDKGQRKEDQHIAGKHQKAEMPDETDVRKQSSGKRRRPVGDKKVAAAEHHGQQHVEQGEPVPPANHLGDFFSVGLT